jgi:hypothetical protein
MSEFFTHYHHAIAWFAVTYGLLGIFVVLITVIPRQLKEIKRDGIFWTRLSLLALTIVLSVMFFFGLWYLLSGLITHPGDTSAGLDLARLWIGTGVFAVCIFIEIIYFFGGSPGKE